MSMYCIQCLLLFLSKLFLNIKSHMDRNKTRVRVNLVKWGIEENPRCNCREIQDDEHLLKCTNVPYNIQNKNDLFNTLTDRVIDLIKYWLEIGI